MPCISVITYRIRVIVYFECRNAEVEEGEIVTDRLTVGVPLNAVILVN